jgi:hypothetical protein
MARVNCDRAKREWAKLQTLARKPAVVVVFLVYVAFVVGFSIWRVVTASGAWERAALLALAGLAWFSSGVLLVSGAAARTHDQPPAWWYREGLAGRFRALRQQQS